MSGSGYDAASEPADALLRCLRWDDEGDARLRALSADDWDRLWSRIVAGQAEHLLARRLLRSAVAPPAHVATGLRMRAMAVAARTLEGRRRLAVAIAATGRPALVLKGIDLADRLYANLGHRPMGDIDVLVQAGDAARYHACLVEAGFSTHAEPSDDLMASPAHHHTFYVAPGGLGLPVELHWRLSGREDHARLDLAALWARSVDSPLGRGARAMAPEDLFLYLCLHLKHHVFETSLTQLWDMAELIDASALPIAWDVVWRRAAEWHIAETVRITLYLLRDTLGVATERLSAWTPDAALRAHLPDLLATLGQYAPSSYAQDRFATVLSSRNSAVERWRALWAGLFPTQLELRMRYGRLDQNLWADVRSYGRRFRHLFVNKSALVGDVLGGSSHVRGEIARFAMLRRHLDRHG